MKSTHVHAHEQRARTLCYTVFHILHDIDSLRSDTKQQMPRKPAYIPTAQSATTQRSLHIAVQGCCHGELNKIYEECKRHEENWGKKIDFLICCGDFQSIRCEEDLDSMAVPVKYREMGDFHEYCDLRGSGGDGGEKTQKKIAPYLTIFIGGNHEASNVLFQNYYGGYVAPNVYYLGHSGVIDVMGLRLGGLSGIWKAFDSTKPYPHPPYDDNTVRSAYHVRQYEVEKLSLFSHLCAAARQALAEENATKDDAASSKLTAYDVRPVDIFLSHDWPVGITKYGDEGQLLRYKPYFGPDIEKGALGNPLTMGLLTELQPRYWCSAHLHCSFNASVTHSEVKRTQFLALDKCTKGKSFLDFIDICVPAQPKEDGGSAGESGLITIPSAWQDVLRVAQPSLEVSHKTGRLGLQVDKNGITLTNPPRKPIAVHTGTNVPIALFQEAAGHLLHQSAGEKFQEAAGHLLHQSAGEKRARSPNEAAAVAPSAQSQAEIASPPAPSASVDDWLIEG